MVDLNQTGAALVVQQIFDEGSEVTASELVRRAEPKDSPAHSHFEWDDSKAGHQFRLHQARHIIRKVTIVRDNKPERLLHVPSIRPKEHYESSGSATGGNGEGYYTTPSVLATKPDDADRAINQIRSQLAGLSCTLERAEKALSTKDKRRKSVKTVTQKVREAEREMTVLG